MANHKSAIKAHRQSLKRKDRNSEFLSRVKTFVKKVEEFISSSKPKEAREAAQKAESEIMKCVAKGILKKNTASRKVSRLVKKTKSITLKKNK
jgi:small subunit ribosomal protein S20